MLRNPLRTLVCLAVIAATTQRGAADPLTPGNLLITHGNRLEEYTPAGVLVQGLTVPPQGCDTVQLRSLVLDVHGNVQIYNGTFNPALTTYNPVAGTFASHFFLGLSTVANVTYGGIGAFGNYVFLSDMFTFGGGEPSGI